MLSEEESVALKRHRTLHDTETEYDRDVLADAVLRLFPPGWDDPLTVEGLVVLGGVRTSISVVFRAKHAAEIQFYDGGGVCAIRTTIEESGSGELKWTLLPAWQHPINMKEARELLVRCGAIEEGK